MFDSQYSSTELTTIYVSDKWTTAAVISGSYMFRNCTKLTGGSGTAYSASNTDATYARIDGGTSSLGYLTAK